MEAFTIGGECVVVRQHDVRGAGVSAAFIFVGDGCKDTRVMRVQPRGSKGANGGRDG